MIELEASRVCTASDHLPARPAAIQPCRVAGRRERTLALATRAAWTAMMRW
jgi:hypothetical protein